MSAAATSRVTSLSINSLRRRRVNLCPTSSASIERFTYPTPNCSHHQNNRVPKSLVQGIRNRSRGSGNRTNQHIPNSRNSNGATVGVNGASPLLFQNGGGGSVGSGSGPGLHLKRGHYAATASAPPLAQHQEDLNKEGPAFESDLIVVLDMDECLIHSQFLQLASDGQSDDYRQFEVDRPPSQAFAHDDAEAESIIPSACDSFKLSLPDGDLVHVNKRPNLDFFLNRITERYETYVFTAAMEVYAKPVLDSLDPKGTMFQKRFYREHCTFDSGLGVYVKDLENAFLRNSGDEENDAAIVRSTNRSSSSSSPSFGALGIPNEDDALSSSPSAISSFNEKRVVLVDNNPYSFLANPSNGVLVSNFYDDPKDDTLYAVMELLYELESAEDVRPILDSRFGLKDALKDVAQTSPSSWR